MKLYSELAEFYFDIEKPGRKIEQEISFLHETFRKYKIKSVLDSGCGTGEHVKDLQALGYQILGIDSSPQMIQVAKLRFPHCKFELGFMEQYRVQKSVDAVISLFGTFNYLTSNDAIEKFFYTAAKNLKPAGILILDVWHSEPIKKIKRKPLGLVANIRVGDLTIRRNRGFRLTRGDDITLVEVNYIYQITKNGNNKELKDKHIMRVFHTKELENWFHMFKFEILYLNSGFNGEKFRKSSGRILYTLKKKI